jgi:hypothetical protein
VEREKGFEPSTSTLAIEANRVSCRYEKRKTSSETMIGVTRTIHPLRQSGAPSGAPPTGVPLAFPSMGLGTTTTARDRVGRSLPLRFSTANAEKRGGPSSIHK